MTYYKLYKESMNLRAGAGTSFAILTSIPKDTIIEVVEEKVVGSGKWGKTTHNGKTGWCSITAVYATKVAKPATPAPTIPTPTTPPAASTVPKSQYDALALEVEKLRIEVTKLTNERNAANIKVAQAENVIKQIAGLVK